AAPSLHRPTLMNAPFTIPTGLRPPAQTCAPCATLGHTSHYFSQPQRGCVSIPPFVRCNPVGVDSIFPGLPRVASRTRQPWADCRYPIGVDQPRGRVTETQRLATLYERKLAALEALKKSLLHQAFTGEL